MSQFEMIEKQIAPCGANCIICMAYLRTKNHCPGCRFDDKNKSISCIQCKIKNCHELNDNNMKYCFECKKYPCDKIKHLDKRYRKNYCYSMIESLNYLNSNGILRHIENQKEIWICKKCGGVICVHRGFCIICGEIWYPNIGNKRSKIK